MRYEVWGLLIDNNSELTIYPPHTSHPIPHFNLLKPPYSPKHGYTNTSPSRLLRER